MTRNQEVVTGIVLQKELAGTLRADIDRLRNYGLTLKDVHWAFAAELGRATASIDDRAETLRWLIDFNRRALAAYDLERAEMARLAEQADRERGGRRRARR